MCLEDDFSRNSSLSLITDNNSANLDSNDEFTLVLTKVCATRDEQNSISQDTPVQDTMDNQLTSIEAMSDWNLPDNSLSAHPMVIRVRNGICRPNLKYLMQISVPPLVPTMIVSALSDPLWKKAMTDEMDTLHQNSTWTIVPREASMNILSCKWVYKHKLNDKG